MHHLLLGFVKMKAKVRAYRVSAATDKMSLRIPVNPYKPVDSYGWMRLRYRNGIHRLELCLRCDTMGVAMQKQMAP